MSLPTLFVLDTVSITVLVFGLYFPRHRHRQLVGALVGLNIGVLGVTQALSSVEVSAGLGLGLFGVLSIIRLRSSEIEQSEVAYYVAALALGLLGGFAVHPAWLSPMLMAAILGALFVADHPRLFARYRQQYMLLDRAFTDEAALRQHLESMLGGTVRSVSVRKVDLVHDTTSVDVRYELAAVPARDLHEVVR